MRQLLERLEERRRDAPNAAVVLSELRKLLQHRLDMADRMRNKNGKCEAGAFEAAISELDSVKKMMERGAYS